MNNKYYHISGYWKDEPTDTFAEYLVTTVGDEVDEARDDELFFYFSNLGELQEAVSMGESTCHDFVITEYSPA